MGTSHSSFRSLATRGAQLNLVALRLMSSEKQLREALLCLECCYEHLRHQPDGAEQVKKFAKRREPLDDYLRAIVPCYVVVRRRKRRDALRRHVNVAG